MKTQVPGTNTPVVAVGVDLGPSSEAVARAGAQIAQARGGRCVLLYSMLTTPAVSSYDRALSRLDILAHSIGDPSTGRPLDFEILSGAPAFSPQRLGRVGRCGGSSGRPSPERAHGSSEPSPPSMACFEARTAPCGSFGLINAFPQHTPSSQSARQSLQISPSRPASTTCSNSVGTANPAFVSAISGPMERVEAQSRLQRLANRSCLETPALRVDQGRPVAVIEKALSSERCDLLVAGSGVPRGWSRFRFGSVASDLAYRGRCHVLIVSEGAGRCHRAAQIASQPSEAAGVGSA